MAAPKESEKEHGWWAVREIDHLFGRFRRYTRFVIYSKWSLLSVAGLLVLALIAWPLITKDKSGLRVSFVDKNSVKGAPESPVMENPEYRGSSANGQQYRVVGTRAIQKTASLIILENVNAQMMKPSGAWYALSAKRAEYDQEKKRIELFEDVTVIDTKATSFTTPKAMVETDTMRVYGREKVEGDGAMGKLVASGFEISDKGNHITFVGGAKQLTVTVNRKKQ